MSRKTVIKIKDIKSKCQNIAFNSANDIISVRVTENYGPCIALDDNSKILFNSPEQYYSVLTDLCVYNTDTVKFHLDLDKFKELYFVDSDDVVDVIYENENVYRVELYNMGNNFAPIYRFLV